MITESQMEMFKGINFETEIKIFESIKSESFSESMSSLVIVASQLIVMNVEERDIDSALEMFSKQVKDEAECFIEFIKEKSK